jgi:hypothetical protein
MMHLKILKKQEKTQTKPKTIKMREIIKIRDEIKINKLNKKIKNLIL